MIFEANESLICPHCNEAQQDGVAGSYTITGRIGPASADATECEACDQLFMAQMLPDGRVEVWIE